MAKKTAPPDNEQKKIAMHVRYENLETQFASQFIVNPTREEIIVNFSPGPIADPQTNQQLLPINTRIAMTPHGAAAPGPGCRPAPCTSWLGINVAAISPIPGSSLINWPTAKTRGAKGYRVAQRRIGPY